MNATTSTSQPLRSFRLDDRAELEAAFLSQDASKSGFIAALQAKVLARAVGIDVDEPRFREMLEVRAFTTPCQDLRSPTICNLSLPKLTLCVQISFTLNKLKTQLTVERD